MKQKIKFDDDSIAVEIFVPSKNVEEKSGMALKKYIKKEAIIKAVVDELNKKDFEFESIKNLGVYQLNLRLWVVRSDKPPVSKQTVSEQIREAISDLGAVQNVSKTLKKFDSLQNDKKKRKTSKAT